ncbi:hypothetical protein LOK49_LG10G01600 [Camellia lanceoleosa]|uniref:Uncharacterized protein n=1 Tax=Camellia lanceoleosa TaxID=1840588 RepID=A0ACC0G600_9ERIC|nr:hypothetical protein LOK49_LG10G01600 [Camellia lanceoleosa]
MLKIILFSLLVLLVKADLASCVINRRRMMMMIEDKPNMVVVDEQQSMGKKEVVRKSSACGDQLDEINHHTIPRESRDSNENHGSTSDVQSKDGGSVDNDTTHS